MKKLARFLALGSLVCVCCVLCLSMVAIGNEIPPIKPPIIITTCGQSPGAVMVKMSIMQAQIAPVENNNTITASELKGKGYKTLIVTTGTSGKGMGAAGTNVNKEIARCKEVIEEAKKEGILVITAHVEGMARRTDSADQQSIDEIMPLGDVMLVVADSNSDGYFTKLAKKYNKPLIEAKDALEIGAKLKEYVEVKK
ncbi:MAG TPA: DUF6305 family protein [Acetomicrobium flavidum]|uniref:DUF6305 domain-containing protein n=1 Tax=Acetomicrobium mobile (strain ATCC BAA-54 / DSM 13181 / JCM 12221 / NGA) TaxID=891968 RepID=I4BXI9_ACEMN|nr:DUF6305 family protein [Acetomicrobium mobile]NLG93870.1 hypothetical protein [Acetomicrobium flavidum]AFM21996.1 hypothetical protein Anamo_1389 [Acetomicrobium mobile DSM 13181]HOJ82941.1 DUF6305 family protein [Acetomicrobium flavidum]HPP14322.1 DUF6305 family protein [Acetomicrobium flavidum]HPU69393.1 DUF6305 family protein [Acetomicrobium flavidum]